MVWIILTVGEWIDEHKTQNRKKFEHDVSNQVTFLPRNKNLDKMI